MMHHKGIVAFAAAVALAIGTVLLHRPELGILLATALLYLNAIPIAIRNFQLSSMFFATPIVLMIPALLKHWVVDREGLVIDRTLLFMMVFLASTILSSLTAEAPGLSVVWIARYATEGMLLYLVIINTIRTKASLRRMMWLLVICGAFLASLSVYQELTGSYGNEFGGLAARRAGTEHVLEAYERGARPVIRQSHRASGPSLDANRYAQILIVLLPLGWCLIRSEPAIVARVAGAGCALFILGGVLLTYSRGAFVGIIAMLGFMGIVRLVTVRQIVVMGATVILSITLLSPGYLGRMGGLLGIEALVDPAAKSAAALDPVERNRAAIMLAAWRVFLDHPILGVGPGHFAPLYVVNYGGEVYSVERLAARHFRAHSMYLELAAETGILGLGAFMAIVISILMRLMWARRRMEAIDPDLAKWAAGCLVAIGGYLTTALFLHLAYERYYWLLLAFAGATVQVAESAIVTGSSNVGAQAGPLAGGRAGPG